MAAVALAGGERSLAPMSGEAAGLIGAHALHLGLTLVTRKLGGLADILGLEIEDWTR
jgi:predicted nucleic acid-binding protein